MDETTWEQRIHVLTHILTEPTANPPLHSQLLVSAHIPCYLNWDFPPFLCNRRRSSSSLLGFRCPPLLRWSLSLFLRRASRFGIPPTSWRCKCPFQQPPPLILSSAVEPPPPRWGAEERRAYFRNRLRRRRRLGIEVPPIVAVSVPNLLLFSLLLWDPLSLRRQLPPPL